MRHIFYPQLLNKHSETLQHMYDANWFPECNELPVESHRKLNFQSLHLHTFHPNKRKRSRAISLSKDSFEGDPDYQEIAEKLILNLPSTRI